MCYSILCHSFFKIATMKNGIQHAVSNTNQENVKCLFTIQGEKANVLYKQFLKKIVWNIASSDIN